MVLSSVKFILATCALIGPTVVSAQLYSGDSDGADRIRISGQLGTLTQQVAAASCSLASGVDVEEAHDVLEHATTQFDMYIVALRHGDENLHILGPETRRRTLEDLDHVAAEWQAIRDAIDAILIDGSDVESAHIIDDHNLKLLELTSILASDIAAQYAHPFEISTADLQLIELAGRQRMLTQKMAKDACEIWSDYHAEEGREDLRATMKIFESSLQALRFGYPPAGITAAPNDAIRDNLDSLISRWGVLRVNLQALVDDEDLNADQKFEVFHDLEVELAELENLLDEYKKYAERAH